MLHIGYFRDPYFISESIKRMLDDEKDFKISFETFSPADLLFKLKHHNIHLLVIVFEDDLAALKEIICIIKKEYPGLPVAYLQSNYDVKKAKELEACGVTVLINKITPLTMIEILLRLATDSIPKENHLIPLNADLKKSFQLSAG